MTCKWCKEEMMFDEVYWVCDNEKCTHYGEAYEDEFFGEWLQMKDGSFELI